MVSLSDRLDDILGAKAARNLDEIFGIKTVDDLLRHYPRDYTEGAAVRGDDGERPPPVSTSPSSTGSPVRWPNR